MIGHEYANWGLLAYKGQIGKIFLGEAEKLSIFPALFLFFPPVPPLNLSIPPHQKLFFRNKKIWVIYISLLLW